MGLPGAVVDCEVQLLQHHAPARILPRDRLVGHEPLEGLMVGDDVEVTAVKVGPEHLAAPHHSEELALVGGVVGFVRVERA